MTAPVVFVVDDDPDVRRSLRWLLGTEGLLVRSCASAEDFLVEFSPERTGCIVLDVHLPGMDGFELLARLEASGPHPPVLVITAYGDIPMAVRALKSGAFDFIEKPYTSGSLLERIHQALARDETLRMRRQERAQLEARLTQLTPREREVMKHLVDGRSNKRIAKVLAIGERTVETHRQRIMHKLEADSVADLTRLAIRLLDHP